MNIIKRDAALYSHYPYCFALTVPLLTQNPHLLDFPVKLIVEASDFSNTTVVLGVSKPS